MSDFESTGVSFYPNPVTDILYFSSNQQIINRIEIFDLNGKLQLTLNYPQESINIKELENGIFFIRVYFESGKYFISKFTKKGS